MKTTLALLILSLVSLSARADRPALTADQFDIRKSSPFDDQDPTYVIAHTVDKSLRDAFRRAFGRIPDDFYWQPNAYHYLHYSLTYSPKASKPVIVSLSAPSYSIDERQSPPTFVRRFRSIEEYNRELGLPLALATEDREYFLLNHGRATYVTPKSPWITARNQGPLTDLLQALGSDLRMSASYWSQGRLLSTTVPRKLKRLTIQSIRLAPTDSRVIVDYEGELLPYDGPGSYIFRAGSRLHGVSVYAQMEIFAEKFAPFFADASELRKFMNRLGRYPGTIKALPRCGAALLGPYDDGIESRWSFPREDD